MKIISYTILSLLAFNSFAQTCDESKTVNLTEKGSSLDNLRITDQNGLGICHIEQLHKMLQAKMNDQADLSRLQLAIVEKRNRDINVQSKPAIRWMKSETAVGGLYIDAGNSCEAFELLKGEDICLAKEDRYEQLSSLKPQHQLELMARLAKYFDNRAKSPASEFLSRINQSPEELDPYIQSCPMTEANFLEIKNEYVEFLSSKNDETLLENAKTLTAQNFMMKADKLIRSGNIKNHIAEVFKELPKDSTLFKKTEKLMLESEKCVILQLNKAEPMCTLLNPNEKSILALTNLGSDLNEIFSIMKGDMDRDKFFEEAYKCEDMHKRKIPNLTCKTEHLLSIVKTQESEEKMLEQFETKMDGLLDRKTPIGISTCTRFFKKPTAKTFDFEKKTFDCGDRRSPEYVDGEGSHAVTIIGSRCKAGVKEYLIQNSWGDGCAYSDKFECTKKGGFWAPSKIIMKNIRNFNYLE